MACRSGYKMISRNLNDLLFSSNNPVQATNANISNQLSSMYISKCNFSDNTQMQNTDGGDKSKNKAKGLIDGNDGGGTTNLSIENVKEIKLTPISSNINKDSKISEMSMNKVTGRPMTPLHALAIESNSIIRSSLPYIQEINYGSMTKTNKVLASKLMERPVSVKSNSLEDKPTVCQSCVYEPPLVYEESEFKKIGKSDNINSTSISTTPPPPPPPSNFRNSSKNLSSIIKTPKPSLGSPKWNNANSSKQILSYSKFKATKHSGNQYKTTGIPIKLTNVVDKEVTETSNHAEPKEIKTQTSTKVDNKLPIKDEIGDVKTTMKKPAAGQYRVSKKLEQILHKKKVLDKEQEYVHNSLSNMKSITNVVIHSQENKLKLNNDRNLHASSAPTQTKRDPNFEISLNNSNYNINQILKMNLQRQTLLIPQIKKKISANHKIEKILTYVPSPTPLSAPPAPPPPSPRKIYGRGVYTKQSKQTGRFCPHVNQEGKVSLKTLVNSNAVKKRTLSVAKKNQKVEKKGQPAKLIEEPTVLIKKAVPLENVKQYQFTYQEKEDKTPSIVSEKRKPTKKPDENIVKISEPKPKKIATLRLNTKQNKVLVNSYVSKIKMMEKHNRVNNLSINAKMHLNSRPPYKMHDNDSAICISDDLMPFQKLKFNANEANFIFGSLHKRQIKKGESFLPKMNFLAEKLVPKRNNFMKTSQYHFRASSPSPKTLFKTIAPSYLSEATKMMYEKQSILKNDDSFPNIRKNMTLESSQKTSPPKKRQGLFEKIYFK